MNKSICQLDCSIRSVLEAVNAEPIGMAFVNDGAGKLCGVLTDGDVRRLLLDGKGLSDCVGRADLHDFVYGMQGDDFHALLDKTNRKVRILPIVDDQMNLVDYFRYEHRLHMTPVAEPDLHGKEFEYLSDAFLSTWISSRGAYIDRFESDFSSYCECTHGVSTANGTVAIHLALTALGVGPGDEVIVPDLTFAATINPVLHLGATPVIVDVERDYWTIAPEAIEAAITPKTKAIIPVHVYGQPCEMSAIMSLAKKHGLYVIEDCAEAHGAVFDGKRVGSFGHISCFSFFGNKIITTGEGGMCITNDQALDEKMRVLRDHGMDKSRRYWHTEIGFNYRMTNMQAAIGCGQVERIDSILSGNDEIEKRYKKAFAALGDLPDSFVWQSQADSRRHKVVWLVSVLVKRRDELIESLKGQGIDARPFFYPLSDMPIYSQYAKSCPIAKELSGLGINFPTIKTVDCDKVAAIVKSLCQ